MTSGLGGCSPEGWRWRRIGAGFAVELFLSDRGVMFVDSVRSPLKREVIRLVQKDFREQLLASGVTSGFSAVVTGGDAAADARRVRPDRADQLLSVRSRETAALGGGYRLRLRTTSISTIPMSTAGLDKTPTDCMQIPVLQGDFLKMARYGKAQQQAALVIGRDRG